MNSAPVRQQRGAAKRQAILDGARAVFGRDGFTRARVEAIAAEAHVSTRTIYNHFDDKQRLFRELIVESAGEVRDLQIAQIERHIGKIEDLWADLNALGLAMNAVRTDFPAHFALVRQIQAEAEHLPADILEAWQETGPRAVHAALATGLAELARRGLLVIEDADRAAHQFVALVSTEIVQRSFGSSIPLDAAVVTRAVADGVTTFLRAFSARSSEI